MAKTTTLQKVTRAAQGVKDAEARLERARADLAIAMLTAKDDRYSVAAIAEAAGHHRTYAYEIIRNAERLSVA
jgi:hypothetical protein